MSRTGPATSSGLWRGFALTATLIGAAFLVSLLNLVPDRILPGWHSSQRDGYAAVWPQGWSFFAELPPEGTVAAYRLDPSGGVGELLTKPMTDRENLGGISRSGYARIFELGVLTEAVPANAWHECGDQPPERCRDTGATTRPRITNPLAEPQLCGGVVFALEVATNPVRVRRVAAVEVDCR